MAASARAIRGVRLAATPAARPVPARGPEAGDRELSRRAIVPGADAAAEVLIRALSPRSEGEPGTRVAGP